MRGRMYTLNCQVLIREIMMTGLHVWAKINIPVHTLRSNYVSFTITDTNTHPLRLIKVINVGEVYSTFFSAI